VGAVAQDGAEATVTRAIAVDPNQGRFGKLAYRCHLALIVRGYKRAERP
jgi:hypothetical protein